MFLLIYILPKSGYFWDSKIRILTCIITLEKSDFVIILTIFFFCFSLSPIQSWFLWDPPCKSSITNCISLTGSISYFAKKIFPVRQAHSSPITAELKIHLSSWFSPFIFVWFHLRSSTRPKLQPFHGHSSVIKARPQTQQLVMLSSLLILSPNSTNKFFPNLKMWKSEKQKLPETLKDFICSLRRSLGWCKNTIHSY